MFVKACCSFFIQHDSIMSTEVNSSKTKDSRNIRTAGNSTVRVPKNDNKTFSHNQRQDANFTLRKTVTVSVITESCLLRDR